MDYPSIFLTIAEIAVAFAGFASIVSALGSRSSIEVDKEFRWLLRGMIVCSLVVVVSALFPLVPQVLRLSDARIWLISSIFLSVATGFLLIGGTIDSGMVKSLLSLWVRIFTLIPLLLSFLLSLSGLIGFSPELVRAFYLIALLLILAVAATLFGTIVLHRIAPRI